MDASVETAFLLSRTRNIDFTDADLTDHQVTSSQISLRCRTGAGFRHSWWFGSRLVAGVTASVVATLLAALTSVVVAGSALDDADAGHPRLHSRTRPVFDDGIPG